MPSKPTKHTASELAQLATSPDVLNSDAGRGVLRKALLGNDSRAIRDAAVLVAQHTVHALAPVLAEAYQSLASANANADPGCLAKQAILQALEALDHSDSDLFAKAAGYEQYERAKGGARDTAAGIRAAGALGLARLGHTDFLCIIGACLGDRDPTVRLAAAQAIAHRGQRDGAGLLSLRLHAGDEVPEIAIECLRGLFTLAPPHALRYAERALANEHDSVRREQALQALGSANDESAIELLASTLETALLAPERAQIIEALGLSRRTRARELLLSIVREGRPSDAEVALRALAIHRYDPRLVEQLEQATAHSRELARRYRELVTRDE